MPWNEDDYPSSMKSLANVTRKKVIDIANALVDDGYDEGRAIPIAIEQAKKWRETASAKEVETFRDSGDPEHRSSKGKKHPNNPDRLDESEQVVSHDKGWAVQSSGAERVTAVYDQKEKAIKRAKEIAKNKGTGVTIFREDGSVQDEHSYERS